MSIRSPALFVTVEIGVTHPVTPDVLFATYTVGVLAWVTEAGVTLRAPVSGGAMTDTAATTTPQATMPDASRGAEPLYLLLCQLFLGVWKRCKSLLWNGLLG